jgi:DNA-binding MarR family transcriptional regulator
MDFFDILVRYEVKLWDAVDTALIREGQVSAAQLQALAVIHRHAGAGRVVDVSGSIGITVGAASKLVDRLERDGLIIRLPNPADRRSSLVVLTDAGAAAYDSATRVRNRTLERLLDPEATASASAALATLLDRLEEATAEVDA